MEYAKPHLTYEEQLDLLIRRGLSCDDRDAALSMLKRVGYYRFSAYCYPLRQLLPPGHPKETDVQFRSSTFLAGHSTDEVFKLYEFDKKLRMLLLDGIESLEVNLRVQIAYVLGRRDRFGHEHRESLNPHLCDMPHFDSGMTRHEAWRKHFAKQVDDAKSEDFVKHYVTKYGGAMPIWVAAEIFDFGSLVRLFKLMNRQDRNEISRAFGVGTGEILEGWILPISHVRNTCAHHSRLWNRRLTYRIGKFPAAAVGEDLAHLQDLEWRQKLYIHAALIAYLLRSINPSTRWPTNFKTHLNKFPVIEGLTPEKDMGFPVDWRQLDLWRH